MTFYLTKVLMNTFYFLIGAKYASVSNKKAKLFSINLLVYVLGLRYIQCRLSSSTFPRALQLDQHPIPYRLVWTASQCMGLRSPLQWVLHFTKRIPTAFHTPSHLKTAPKCNNISDIAVSHRSEEWLWYPVLDTFQDGRLCKMQVLNFLNE